MSEKIPTIESGQERIPTKEEILNIFEKLARGKSFEITKETEDEKGLHKLEVKLKETNEKGEVVEYAYMRVGSHYPDSKRIPVIHLYRTDAHGDPYGDTLAKYIEGRWKFFELEK